MFKQITHKLWPSKCIKKAVWERGELRCSCGEILALRYTFDGTTRVFVYPEFKKYQQQIADGQNQISEDEVIGAICFDDFSDFMEDLKKSPLNTYVSDEDIVEETNEEDT